MKKMIVGIIIGAALAFSGQAMADNLSNVGKKVDAEFPVVIDGKSLSVKAISIDGTSYAPLRSIGENTGYEVDFVDKEVVFTQVTKGVTAVPETSEPSATGGQLPIYTEPEHYFTLETIDKAISDYNGMLRGAQRNYDISISDGVSESKKVELDKRMEELKQGLERLKSIKADLEAQQ